MLERARSISSSGEPPEHAHAHAHAPGSAVDAHLTAAPTAASKVVATLGEVSLRPAVLDELLAAGVSCFRLDAGILRPPSWFVNAVSMATAAVQRSGRLCAFMLDMRAGLETSLCRREAEPLSIVAGTEVTLTIARDDSEWWSAERPNVLPLADSRLFNALQPGDTLHASRYLSAGGVESALSLCVLSVDKEECTAQLRAENSAVLDGYAQDAHIVVSRVVGQEGDDAASAVSPALCEADVEVLAALVAAGHTDAIDFIALSFCESGAQIEEARTMLATHGLGDCGVLAKIETRLGVAAFEEILDACDGIIISRGNLGNSVRLEACVRLQKEIIVRTNLAGKPVMLTRVLDSMCAATRPTRAEATDVANAVLDGVDGFVLGAETVRGLYPIEVVQCVQSISVEAEKVFNHRRFFTTRFEALVKEGTPPGLRASMASSLVRVADKVAAKLIVVRFFLWVRAGFDPHPLPPLAGLHQDGAAAPGGESVASRDSHPRYLSADAHMRRRHPLAHPGPRGGAARAAAALRDPHPGGPAGGAERGGDAHSGASVCGAQPAGGARRQRGAWSPAARG